MDNEYIDNIEAALKMGLKEVHLIGSCTIFRDIFIYTELIKEKHLGVK